MTNTKIRWIILSLLLLSGWIRIPVSSSTTLPQTLPLQIAIPKTSLDLSDLDLRDEKNRPVKSMGAVCQVKNLFSRNLKDLLLSNLTPKKREFYSRLSQTWDLISGWLCTKSAAVIAFVESFWQEKKIFQKIISSVFAPTVLFSREDSLTPESSHFDLTYLIVSTTRLLR